MRVFHCACVALLLVSASSACSKAEISVKYAAGFDPGRHKISVFGVYKDGRMNSEAWGGLAGHIGAALGHSSCEGGYGGAVFPFEKDITTAIDEYTASNGPTDELLAQIAPAAAGDMLLVFTIAGRLPVPVKIRVQDQGQPPPGGAQSPGRRGRQSKNYDLNELQLTAQVFSVAESKTVALVNIDYTGQSMDEAMDKFTTQVGAALPGGQCVGWNLDAKLDIDKIRALGQ